MYNVHKTRWGIELETTVPRDMNVDIGEYHHGYQVEWLPDGWKAERDSSIQAENDRRTGCEFVSPKLYGLDGLRQAALAAKEIRARGGSVNSSCGMHVTVEWTGDVRALARLVSLMGNHEKGIFASTGSRMREHATYTKPLKSYPDESRARQYAFRDRYHSLNLTHLGAGRNRIEFRAFCGTLNPTKVVGYIQMCLGLVEIAMTSNRTPEWEYKMPEGKTSCWNRGGTGKNEIARLMYRLGWIKGWYKGANKDKRFGCLFDGQREEVCSKAEADREMQNVKNKLKAMAEKYDDQDEDSQE